MIPAFSADTTMLTEAQADSIKEEIYMNLHVQAAGNASISQHILTREHGRIQNNSDNCNNAVFKINIFVGFALADFTVPNIGCAPLYS